MATGCSDHQSSPFLQDVSTASTVSSSSNGSENEWIKPCGNCPIGKQKIIGGLDYYISPLKSDPHLEENLRRGSEEWRYARRSKGSKLRRICIYTSLCIISIILSVTITVLLLKYVSILGNGDSASGQQVKMCVPCSPKEQQLQETGIESSQTYFCCGSDDATMKELIIEGVKLSLQERLKDEDLHYILNNPLLPPPINKNAAHVFLKLPTSPQSNRHSHANQPSEDNYDVLRDWSSDGDAAFIRQGIEFNSSRGQFRVKDAGVYVVYSRIVYENTGSSDDDRINRPRVIFGHRISLYPRGNHHRTLLEDEQVMECEVGTVCYNSKIFSTIHLRKDSQIAVEVRQSALVSVRSQTSYFGLYKID